MSACAPFPSWGAELAARGGVLGVEKPIGLGWMAGDLHPSGACGDARDASAEKGAAVLAHAARRLAALLAELAELPPWPAASGR